jgi:hypothetical protein
MVKWKHYIILNISQENKHKYTCLEIKIIEYT